MTAVVLEDEGERRLRLEPIAIGFGSGTGIFFSKIEFYNTKFFLNIYFN
jgi:hypothetical protein